MVSLRSTSLAAAFAAAAAQYPGHGISKSTYSCNDPIAGKKFMEKYFPVDTPEDECDNDICSCAAQGDIAAWEVQQGRVYTKMKNHHGSSTAGNGFGLHLVNVSEHWTTGGMSTAQVEAQFNDKVGAMTSFDSFMDFNVAFATTGLAAYKEAFKADGVSYLAGTWEDSKGTSYTSIFVHVPNTQLILELVQQTSLEYADGEAKPISLEQRVPTSALEHFESTKDADDVGAYLTPLAVNRAASSTAMGKLEDFYVSGMGTKKTLDETSSNGDVTKKCFQWTGATVDVCYTERPDSATKGSFKVSDFEDMLNTVHKNLLDGHPFCGQDKWEDNHYAIDSMSADTSSIIKYINKEKPFHLCEKKGSGKGRSKDAGGKGKGYGMPSGGTSVHYVFDPCGWGIQLDMSFSSSPSDCSSSSMVEEGVPEVTGGNNPVCTLDFTVCPSESKKPAVEAEFGCGDCGRAYQTCCAGFAAKGFPCGCHLKGGGSGQATGDCGDCGSAYTVCCMGFAAKGYPCQCDINDGSILV